MRSEKGITLVALIGIFILLVILAGVSISFAVRGNNEEALPENEATVVEEQEVVEDEVVVNPNVTNTEVTEDDEVADYEDVTNTVENTVEEDVVTNAVEEVEE